MSSFFRPTQSDIILENISNNYHQLLKLNQGNGARFFCPMIKANAYGHGVVEIYRQLKSEGCQNFGVALVEEALFLKGKQKVKANEILVFSKFNSHSLSVSLDNKFIPVISSLDELSLLVQALKGETQSAAIHLKVNTGMQRLGFEVNQLDQVLKVLKKNPKIEVLGLCSHLLMGEDGAQEGGYTQMQKEAFLEWKDGFGDFENCQFHLFNSAGLVASALGKKGAQIGSRPGIALYGMCPEIKGVDEAKLKGLLELKPAMHLHTQISQVHHIKKGTPVSYGATWIAEKDSVVGVLPVGYGDGYPRIFSNRGFVTIEGQRAPIAGRVCMDYCLIDLTELPTALQSVGQVVYLWGDSNLGHPYTEEIAKTVGTISYELTTGLTSRVPRFYKG